MLMPSRMPLVSFSTLTPLRSVAEDAVLVISRFSMVMYCWSSR